MTAIPEDEVALAFYRDAIEALNAYGVPFLVGGAFAVALYTGIERHTKDLDFFIRPEDRDAALRALRLRGYKTEITAHHWLAKAFHGDAFVDIIFSSGNGIATVDDEWFEHAVHGEILGMHVLVCPPEESLWSKSFVMERERFDGADVQHMLLRCEHLDWPRLLRRFGSHWQVLLAHLVLFDFIYPSERSRIPAQVRSELLAREAREGQIIESRRICRGTLLSREQYLVDLECWGFEDARLVRGGSMTPKQVEEWTDAISDAE